MKRRFAAYLLAGLLLISVAYSITAANANFVSMYMLFPANPITDQPTIILQSPNETTIPTNSLSISFAVTIPESWTTHYSEYYTGESRTTFFGKITSITCMVDQTIVLNDETVLGRGVDYPSCYYRPANYSMTYNYIATANNLTVGQHQATVKVTANTLYAADEHNVGSVDVSTTSTLNFAVIYPPTISVQSIQNKTYDRTTLPLVFQVVASKPFTDYCWLGYSFDNQTNITISGNSTLTGLPEGNHSLVVYANDTFGNMGKSDIVFFNIDTTPPSISNLSIEDKTCNTTQIPLTFSTNESTSWVGYSLDSQANVTVNGNFTLDGLTEGTHNIVIYANDSMGNMGKSDAAFFTVNTSTPSPKAEYPTEMVLVATIIGVVALGVSALVYFKKRKN